MIESITDIYLYRDDIEKAVIFPGCISFCDLDEITKQHLIQLHNVCEQRKTNTFSLHEGGFSYRVQVIETLSEKMLALRRCDKIIMEISKLGLHKQVHDFLMHPSLRSGGLILISGRSGHGKSTTCASVVKSRLTMFGGVCQTIEDPIEFDLHGRHGNGICIQREVVEGEFHSAIKESLRCYPTNSTNILLLGEIRDKETAQIALRSSADGHLILTTMHASNPISALQRLIAMASDVMPEEMARELICDGLRLVLTQNLKSDHAGRRLECTSLMNTMRVRGGLISKTEPLSMLVSEFEDQQRKLANGIPILSASDWGRFS